MKDDDVENPSFSRLGYYCMVSLITVQDMEEEEEKLKWDSVYEALLALLPA